MDRPHDGWVEIGAAFGDARKAHRATFTVSVLFDLTFGEKRSSMRSERQAGYGLVSILSCCCEVSELVRRIGERQEAKGGCTKRKVGVEVLE